MNGPVTYNREVQPLRKFWASLQPMWEGLFGVDLRSLALLRIGLALYLLHDLWDRVPDIVVFYTDHGAFPREALYLLEKHDRWPYPSIHALSGELWWEILLFALQAFINLWYLVGYRTRLSGILSWILLISLQNRNHLILHGGDQMIRHMLFWSLLVPVGARFSIDGWVALRKARSNASREETPSLYLSTATAGLLLQTALVYWFTVALKTGKEWHLEGSALYYALSLDLYSAPPGQWVLHNMPWVLKPMTWLALITEFGSVTLCFCPVYTNIIRKWVPLGMIGFHLFGIGGLMDVGPITYASCLLWLAFFPAESWEDAIKLWERLKKTPLKPVLERIELLRTRVITARNAHWVAHPPQKTPNLALYPVWAGASVMIFAFMLLWNLRGWQNKFETIFPYSINPVAYYLRFDQSWGMFAPRPMIDDGWYVFPSIHHDKTEGDAYWNQPVAWDKPSQVTRRFRNERWRKYVMNLETGTYRDYRTYFMQYLCNRQNDSLTLGDGKKWERLAFYYVVESTPPMGQPYKQPERVLITEEICSSY
jgi:hypothetical protein